MEGILIREVPEIVIMDQEEQVILLREQQEEIQPREEPHLQEQQEATQQEEPQKIVVRHLQVEKLLKQNRKFFSRLCEKSGVILYNVRYK